MKFRFTITSIAITLLLIMTSCPDDYNHPTKRVFVHQIEVQNMDMSGPHPVENNTAISMKAYSIALVTMVSDEPKTEGISANLRPMINDEYHPSQTLESIELFCDRDFDDNYPAGSNIMEFFDKDNLPTGRYDENAIRIDYFVMIKQPKNPGKYQFTIRYNFEDEMIEATTKVIELY